MIDAWFESVYKILALFGLLVFVNKELFRFLFPHISNLLISNPGFQVLNLIKSSNQTLFEILFDVLCYNFHTMVFMVNFTVVQLILDKVGEFLVVVVAIDSIRWTFTFQKWPVKLGLKLEKLLSFNLITHIVRSDLIVILGHTSSVLLTISFLRSILICVLVLILFILVLLHDALLHLLCLATHKHWLIWLLLVIRI